MENDLVIIGKCYSDIEAKILKSFFEDHEIPCYIQGENHHQLLGVLGAYIEMRVLVPFSFKDQATQLFEEFQKAQASPSIPEES